MYDIIIIGMGISGITAGIYAKRSNKKVLLIDKGMPGGLLNNIDKINNVRLFDEKRKEELRKGISSGGQILSNGEWILDRFHNFRQEPLSVQIHRLAVYGYSAEEAEFIIKEVLNDEAMAIVERNLGYAMKP